MFSVFCFKAVNWFSIFSIVTKCGEAKYVALSTTVNRIPIKECFESMIQCVYVYKYGKVREQ